MGAQNPAYRKRWALDRARGIQRLVSPRAAAAHCWELENLGLSRRSIAEAAHVSPTTITRLMNHTDQQLQRAVADRILAVTAEQILARHRELGFVPAIGARRRIRTLYAIGHTAASIAAVLDDDVVPHDIRNILNHPGRWITRANHDLVVAAYERLWNEPGPSKLNRSRAARYGWLPPLAWDDDALDNPDPMVEEDARGHLAGAPTGRRSRDDVANDVEWFLSDVDSLGTCEQVAHRFGFGTVDAIQHALARAGRQDLLDRLSRNAELAGHAVTRRSA